MKKTNLPLFCALICMLFGSLGSVSSKPSLPDMDGCTWSAPLNLQDSLRGAASMYIYWNTPAEGAPPGGYVVKVFHENAFTPLNIIYTMQLSARIDQLSPGTVYRIEVSSVCGNGDPGPAALMTLPTIVVEMIVNGDELTCANPPSPPVGATSDFASYSVPNCNTTAYCGAMYYTFPIVSIGETQIYNYKVYQNNAANAYCWFAVERKFDANGAMHYRIKRKEFNISVDANLVLDQYLVIYSGDVPIANVGFYYSKCHFTKMYSGTPKLTGICDLFVQCNGDNTSALVNETEEDTEANNQGNYYTEDKGVTIEAMPDVFCMPNPANEYLKIYLLTDITEETTFSIIDINGRVINKIRYSGGTEEDIPFETIDIRSLEPGVYFVSADNGLKIQYLKFMKI